MLYIPSGWLMRCCSVQLPQATPTVHEQRQSNTTTPHTETVHSISPNPTVNSLLLHFKIPGGNAARTVIAVCCDSHETHTLRNFGKRLLELSCPSVCLCLHKCVPKHGTTYLQLEGLS